ncbi:MAG: hypothetical protein ABJD11_00325 [Gemmatimonadota bacterium]
MDLRRRATRLLSGATLLLLLCSTPLVAQKVSPLIKYGKWGTLGVSLAFNALAFRTHDQAESAFHRLENYCNVDFARCNTGSNGAYGDPLSEQLFQQSLSYDRRTRLRLIAGETALLGSVAMFVWELSQPKGPPDNIPFRPEVSTRDGTTHLGIRFTF